jgi:hypothetical protein
MVTKGYGLAVNDIDWSCPSDLEPYAEAHKLEMAEMDNYIYSVFGNYGISALMFAIEHNLAKNPKSEYIKKPMLNFNISNEISEEDKQREVDLFFAQERARKRNFNRRKKGNNE